MSSFLREDFIDPLRFCPLYLAIAGFTSISLKELRKIGSEMGGWTKSFREKVLP